MILCILHYNSKMYLGLLALVKVLVLVLDLDLDGWNQKSSTTFFLVLSNTVDLTRTKNMSNISNFNLYLIPDL